MQKVFEFCQHIGDWRVLVQTKDINNKAVTTEKIADGAVTLPKLAQNVIEYIANGISDAIAAYKRLVDAALAKLHADDQAIVEHHNDDMRKINKRMDYLQQLVESQHEHGIAVANEFGSNTKIGISQKTLTDFANYVEQKFSDITGTPDTGIIMSATPDYYVSEEGCDVNITVRAMSTPTEIERIEFYVGDYDTPMLDDEGNPIVFEHVDSQKQFTYHIDDDTLILCKAWILGIEYKANTEIKRLSEFFLGTCQGGADADALIENIKEYVIVPENSIDVKDRSCLRVAKDVDCADDDHIVIVVEKSHYNDKILRMDMNGMEIDSTTLTLVKNDTEYIAYVSENTFNAGTYNIDING